MAHIGRPMKNIEAPRPLKTQSRSSLKNNFMLIEELIQLIENVAMALQSGISNTEPMASLVQNLRMHGPQLETVSKDTLDRAFVVFRNASQDERLNIMTRLNLLELIELRAKGWEDNGFNSYYKTKQATNVELPDVQHHVDGIQAGYLSTSPTFGGTAAAIAAVGSAQQQQLLLSPGEVIRNSGKFPKPTKIPGKTYCKDEVVIRNADSGKVMGIKGRRVHMIEELSETIISFQRVNPGAKERLVQITGPSEEKINYAKQLIEDTIRRNASPVRLEPAMSGVHAGGGGSCSSLASSNSDEAQPRAGAGSGANAPSTLSNRLSFNSAQNFMTAQQAATQQQVINMMGNTSTPTSASSGGKALRSNQQVILHSFSTNDASLGEYKYTVNVGQHVIKITGDCCDYVRIAKLVLDDYFSSAEFLASVEAGAAFDGTVASPISTPSTPMGAPQFMMGTPLHAAPPLADSGINLNYMSGQGGNSHDGDDEVFADGSASKSSSQSNGLSRSRRSHFSRKDSTPEAASNNVRKSESGSNSNSPRITYECEHLLYYAQSPHAWKFPTNWEMLCEKFPAIVRNKVTHGAPITALTFRAAAFNTPANAHTNSLSVSSTNVAGSSTYAGGRTAWMRNSGAIVNANDAVPFHTPLLNVRRKGFLNRTTYSIDEEKYVELQLRQMLQAEGINAKESQKVTKNQDTNVDTITNPSEKVQLALTNADITQIDAKDNVANNNNNNINVNNSSVGNNNNNVQQHHYSLLGKQMEIISAISECNRKLDALDNTSTRRSFSSNSGSDDATNDVYEAAANDDSDVVELVGVVDVVVESNFDTDMASKEAIAESAKRREFVRSYSNAY